MLTHDEVVLAFRYCLGRNPNAQELKECFRRFQGIDGYRTLREFLMSQAEFISRVQPLLRANRLTNPIDVFERNTFVFIHIQKTAGTTVTKALEEQFDLARCCPERFNHLHLYSASELAEYDLYSGHFDLFSTRYIPRRKKFVFSIFRDPAERLVSFYRFVRGHPKGKDLISDPLFALADHLSIEEYYAHPAVRSSRIVNNHYRAVLSGSLAPTVSQELQYRGTLENAIDAMHHLDAIGLTSRLRESLNHIFSAAGLQNPKKVPILMSSETMHLIDDEVRPPIQVEMTGRLQQIMADLIDDDLAIFREAKAVFAERIIGSS